jgi:hypothetical protein
MPIIASRAGGSASAYGGVGASGGALLGVATNLTFTSTSYIHGAVMDGDTLYGAMSVYTTDRNLGMLKMNVKTGVVSWVKNYTASGGFMYGIGILDSGNIVGVGESGNSPGYIRVALRNTSGTTLYNQGFKGNTDSTTGPAGTNALLSFGGNFTAGTTVGGYTPGRCGHLRWSDANPPAINQSRWWTHGHTNYSQNMVAQAKDGYYVHYMTMGVYTDYRMYIIRLIQSTSGIQDISYWGGDAYSMEPKAMDVEDNTSTITYIAGKNQATTKGFWIAKWDKDNGYYWQKNFTISGMDNCNPTAVTVDRVNSAVYVAGSYNLNSGYTTDRGFLVKLSTTDGSVIWQRDIYTLNAPYQETNKIILSGDNVVLAGSGGVLGSGSPRPMVILYPKSGLPSAKVVDVGPMLSWTIANGSFTSSTASKDAPTVISGTNTTQGTGTDGITLSDSTPTFTTASQGF